MYAVVETGGKQYRAEETTVLRVETLDAEVGQSVVLDRVLMLGGSDSVKIGAPYVSGATVTARVIRHGRDKKIVGFTFKPKKNQRRRFGHRQNFTEIVIETINA